MHRPVTLSLLLSMVVACSSASGAALLAPGAKAPELVGEAPSGERVSLSSQRGKLALVFFYPKDDTPGCTREACALRDAFDRYTQSGITIFGVSRDDTASHRAFQKKHELPFPLVADVEGSIQSAYGVPSRFGRLAARVSFLVGRDGKIVRVFPEVDPAVHADEVLAAAKKL
jgi:peroxiredoxin Q/BCP